MAAANSGALRDNYPVVLALAIFLVQLGLGVILFATFQEWVPSQLETSDAWGGFLLAAYGGARFLFEAPTGAISDRVERRLGLLVGFGLMLPAILLMAAFPDERAYLGFAALLGLATAFLWPATYAISADLYPLDRRGKVIGFLNLAQLLGFGTGALAGAFLVRGPGWAQFALAGAAVAAAFLATVRGLPNYRQRSLFTLLPPPHRPSARPVLSGRLVSLGAIVFTASLGIAMAVPAIRPFGDEQLDVSFSTLTLALVPGVVVGAALYIPAGHLADRFGRIVPFVAGQALVTGGLLTCAATTSLPLASAGAAAIFAGNVLTVPALNAAVMDIAPETHRGTLIGFMVALSGLGLAIGPALGGMVIQWAGAPGAFRVAAAVSAAAALGLSAYGLLERRGRNARPVEYVPSP
jgi:MFS family permease